MTYRLSEKRTEMKHCTEHFLKICEIFSFPPEAADTLCRTAQRIDAEPDFCDRFETITDGYMRQGTCALPAALGKLWQLADEKGVHRYTANMVFIMHCSEFLLQNYLAAGYEETLFWLTMADLRYKLLECMTCKHVVGTFVPEWYDGFLKSKRFALGRFQYEESAFPMDYVTAHGYALKKGDKCFSFHIPSSGVPLTDEIRLDSYRKAYAFYRDRGELTEGKLVLLCSSWLLYPKHAEFLPESLNIRRFMNDFEIFKAEPSETFRDSWRVFGDASELPPEQWPEDTSLRKAYKQWILAGNPAGGGHGVIVFDGQKMIH